MDFIYTCTYSIHKHASWAVNKERQGGAVLSHSVRCRNNTYQLAVVRGEGPIVSHARSADEDVPDDVGDLLLEQGDALLPAHLLVPQRGRQLPRPAQPRLRQSHGLRCRRDNPSTPPSGAF